jgi:hypothetical protein
MPLIIKILAMWTVLSIAVGLFIAPIFARRVHVAEEHETEAPQDWFARHKFRRWA